MTAERQLLHASCVAIDGKAVLLLGKPGSGKSDLALRLIDGGAQLVSDDQVELTLDESGLFASPPKQIAGLFEMRGVGIFQMEYARNVPVALAVDLVARAQVARMPETEFFDCLGGQLPLLSLHAFDASVGAKIRLFLKTL